MTLVLLCHIQEKNILLKSDHLFLLFLQLITLLSALALPNPHCVLLYYNIRLGQESSFFSESGLNGRSIIGFPLEESVRVASVNESRDPCRSWDDFTGREGAA